MELNIRREIWKQIPYIHFNYSESIDKDKAFSSTS